jgi:hypothetical protein
VRRRQTQGSPRKSVTEHHRAADLTSRSRLRRFEGERVAAVGRLAPRCGKVQMAASNHAVPTTPVSDAFADPSPRRSWPASCSDRCRRSAGP